MPGNQIACFDVFISACGLEADDAHSSGSSATDLGGVHAESLAGFTNHDLAFIHGVIGSGAISVCDMFIIGDQWRNPVLDRDDSTNAVVVCPYHLPPSSDDGVDDVP